jgi:hypothetical protein
MLASTLPWTHVQSKGYNASTAREAYGATADSVQLCYVHIVLHCMARTCVMGVRRSNFTLMPGLLASQQQLRAASTSQSQQDLKTMVGSTTRGIVGHLLATRCSVSAAHREASTPRVLATSSKPPVGASRRWA